MNMNYTGTGCEAWIPLPQNMVQRRNATNMVMNLRVQYSEGGGADFHDKVKGY